MDIQATLLSTSSPNKTASQHLSQWLLGQVLNATVTSRKSTDTLILKINNQSIEAKTNSNKPIHMGAQLKLVVEQQGTPTILRVLQQEPPKLIQETKQQLLRENVPKQASMEKLANILNQITNNTRSVAQTLPAPIEQQIKKLIAQLPTKINLNNASGLKTTVRNSGIFLESKLLTEAINKQTSINKIQTTTNINTPNITQDLKANLLQLSEIVTKYKQGSKKTVSTFIKAAGVIPLLEVAKNSGTNTKPQPGNAALLNDIDSKVDIETISKQVESSVARIEVNQSKAIVTHDNQLPAWSIEMPVKDNQDVDLFSLNIQHDENSKSESKNERIWTVNLKINFKDKGTVSAKLSILDKEVSATLWSEDQRLNDLIDNNLSLLSKRIERCGLSMSKIICLTGSPSSQDERMIANNLINISV
ncbi:MAG: flagellar hook-length control protein FliK [marine bacterium B5-7]|nr:MAG: flagellar hook-length control protein FliK [marine bacterium B5-7]